MSVTVGELVGYIRADDGQFIHALDESDARMQVFQRQADGTLAEVEHDFGARGRAMGEALRSGIDETLAALHPEIPLDADTRPADAAVERLVRRLEELHANVNVDVPPEQAMRELDEIQSALQLLSQRHADPQIRVDAADAVFTLDLVRSTLAEVDREHPHVNVDVDAAAALTELAAVDEAERRVGDNDGATRARGPFGMLASAIGMVLGPIGSALGSIGMMPLAITAAIPAAAGLAAALMNIAPAAAVGATGVFALGSAVGAIKLGTSGISGALKAAFAPAVSGGGAAAHSANQAASAIWALKDATRQAAYANEAAAASTASAERNVTDAQKSALQAQADLNASREQATQDLQDMNNSLADAYLSQKQAVLDVDTAEKNLAAVKATGSKATADQIAQAQLDYDRAVQRLKEQQIQTQRLQEDTTKANKAGVDGSTVMVNARQKVASANRTLSDQEKALATARTQQARTAAAGLESIKKAQEALAASAASSGGGGGGINKLAQALAKLSPNARAFVQQVISLHGAWTSMQQAIQNKLFEGLATTLHSTATAVLPVLRTNLVATAGTLNVMARGVMTTARDLARSGVLGQALASASQGLHNLAGIPSIVVKAFTQIAAAGGPAFGQLTTSVAKVVSDIGGKLNSAFKSGAMSQAITTAVGLLKELGQIAVNVFSIIGSVMKATQTTGGGFLGVLKTITDQLAKAFASPAIQSGLQALFSTFQVLGATVAPLLVQALQVIAPVLTALGPPVQDLVRSLGSALRPILTALGPVLVAAAQALGQLVQAALPLLPVVSQMITDLGPLLTPVLQIVGQLFKDIAPVVGDLGRRLLPPFAKLVKTVADAFTLLAPVLDKAMQQLGTQGLTPIVDGLVTIFADFVQNGATQFMQGLTMLMPVIPQLVPLIVQLGQSIGQVLTAIAPLLPQLMTMSTQMALQLLPALLPLLPPLITLSTLFLQLATGVLTKVVIPALSGVISFMKTMRHAFQPAIDAVKWLTGTISRAFESLSDHLVGHSVIPDMINSIVRWFAGLPGKAWRVLSGLAGSIAGRAWDAGASMVRAITSGLSSAVSWISGLPGRAVNALGDLSGVLWKSGRSLLQGFIDGIGSMLTAAGNAAGSVLDYVKGFFPNSPAKRGPFSGSGWTLFSGIATGSDFAAGLARQHGVVGAAAAALMSTAQDGLGAPGTPMGALTTPPASVSGYRGGAGGSGSGGGSVAGRVAVVLELKGGDSDLLRLLRKNISVQGGDVQFVLGEG